MSLEILSTQGAYPQRHADSSSCQESISGLRTRRVDIRGRPAGALTFRARRLKPRYTNTVAILINQGSNWWVVAHCTKVAAPSTPRLIPRSRVLSPVLERRTFQSAYEARRQPPHEARGWWL